MNRNSKFILTIVLVIVILAALFSASMIYIIHAPKSAPLAPPPVAETFLPDTEIR